jgi:putative membrane protein
VDVILTRYFHFAGIMVLSFALITEHWLAKKEVSGRRMRRLAVVDAVYGVSAAVVLFTGLIQWLWVGKPAAFYTENPVFHVKLAVFVVIALLSIYPTVFFVKHRKTDAETVRIPGPVVMSLRFELLLLFVMPLLGVFIARGYGA